MQPDLWLRIPFALNILILVPVCAAVFAGRGRSIVFQNAVAREPGLELLVGSLWLAILLSSMVGVIAPSPMLPVLFAQIVYKAVWLATYVAPALLRRQPVPAGISICFLGIVLTWPFFIWASGMELLLL